MKFQFPSNGKVYSEKWSAHKSLWLHRVSIPFKRESVFRVKLTPLLLPKQLSFNSLQTGKCIQRLAEKKLEAQARVSIPFKRESVFRVQGLLPDFITSRLKFQFPSNGKVYSERPRLQRPLLEQKSFNSLQTGKCIQSSDAHPYANLIAGVSIPFKRESVFRGISDAGGRMSSNSSSFNSLQTGKCIQRRQQNLTH